MKKYNIKHPMVLMSIMGMLGYIALGVVKETDINYKNLLEDIIVVTMVICLFIINCKNPKK